jgi:predicted RNA-binding Zn-ribbon protein involved in translation (DUF1610 family)
VVTATCPTCKATNEVQDQATAYRCPNCQQLWHFARCTKCAMFLYVKEEFQVYVCTGCGARYNAHWGASAVQNTQVSNPQAGRNSTKAGCLVIFFIVCAILLFFALIHDNDNQKAPSPSAGGGQQTNQPMTKEFAQKLLRCQELRNIPSGQMTEDDRIEMQEVCKGIR